MLIGFGFHCLHERERERERESPLLWLGSMEDVDDFFFFNDDMMWNLTKAGPFGPTPGSKP